MHTVETELHFGEVQDRFSVYLPHLCSKYYFIYWNTTRQANTHTIKSLQRGKYILFQCSVIKQRDKNQAFNNC